MEASSSKAGRTVKECEEHLEVNEEWRKDEGYSDQRVTTSHFLL